MSIYMLLKLSLTHTNTWSNQRGEVANVHPKTQQCTQSLKRNEKEERKNNERLLKNQGIIITKSVSKSKSIIMNKITLDIHRDQDFSTLPNSLHSIFLAKLLG